MSSIFDIVISFVAALIAAAFAHFGAAEMPTQRSDTPAPQEAPAAYIEPAKAPAPPAPPEPMAAADTAMMLAETDDNSGDEAAEKIAAEMIEHEAQMHAHEAMMHEYEARIHDAETRRNARIQDSEARKVEKHADAIAALSSKDLMSRKDWGVDTDDLKVLERTLSDDIEVNVMVDIVLSDISPAGACQTGSQIERSLEIQARQILKSEVSVTL